VDELNQDDSRRYWDGNLDPQNLGAGSGLGDLERQWAFYRSDEQRFAESHMPPLEGARCLELGAGLGVHALWLAHNGARVIAVDFSPRRLKALAEEARRHGLAERIHCVAAAAEALPIESGRLDLVYSKAVLIHTRLGEALDEARRVLRDGGHAVFLEPCGGNPFAALYRRVFAPKAWRRITRYFDEESAAEVRRAFPGAERRSFYLLGFLAFVWQFAWPRPGLFRACLALARCLDRPLLALAPSLGRYAWFWVFAGRKTPSGK
jgi:SAM-dependent methyltransferase